MFVVSSAERVVKGPSRPSDCVDMLAKPVRCMGVDAEYSEVGGREGGGERRYPAADDGVDKVNSIAYLRQVDDGDATCSRERD